MGYADTLDPNWTIVTTPGDLERYYRAVAEDKTSQSLLVVGPTSTGKSEIAKKVFKFVYPDTSYPAEKHRHALYLDGGGSPAQLYTQAYRHADRTLFIDDPSREFVRSADGRRLWKQLFATTRGKRQLTWQTKASFLEKEEVPQSFWTGSRVIAVCNEFHGLGPDIEAVKARAICLFYSPSLETRIQYAAEWAEKEQGGREVIRWLRNHYRKGVVRHIHQRHVFKALDFKRSEDQGLKTTDWRQYLLRVSQDPSLEESPDVSADVETMLRWVGEHTQCGVFTAANLSHGIRRFREDRGRIDAALDLALKQGKVHRLPKPPRPHGSRVRMPAEIYCLGPASRPNPSPRLSVITGEGIGMPTESTNATKATKETRKTAHA